MILRKFILITILIVGFFYYGANQVNAQGVGTQLGNDIQNLSNSTVSGSDDAALQDLVSQIIRIAMPVAVLAIVLLFSYAGILMITSQGNPEKLKQAREVVVNAVLGFIMIALAASILSVVANTLNI